MSDAPFAVLPPEHVGDTQGVRLDRITQDRVRDVLEADDVGQIPADAGGHEIEPGVADVGPTPREPAEGIADLVRPPAEGHSRPEEGDRVLARRHSQPRLRVPVTQGSPRLGLAVEGCGEKVVELAHSVLRSLGATCPSGHSWPNSENASRPGLLIPGLESP